MPIYRNQKRDIQVNNQRIEALRLSRQRAAMASGAGALTQIGGNVVGGTPENYYMNAAAQSQAYDGALSRPGRRRSRGGGGGAGGGRGLIMQSGAPSQPRVDPSTQWWMNAMAGQQNRMAGEQALILNDRKHTEELRDWEDARRKEEIGLIEKGIAPGIARGATFGEIGALQFPTKEKPNQPKYIEGADAYYEDKARQQGYDTSDFLEDDEGARIKALAAYKTTLVGDNEEKAKALEEFDAEYQMTKRPSSQQKKFIERVKAYMASGMDEDTVVRQAMRDAGIPQAMPDGGWPLADRRAGMGDLKVSESGAALNLPPAAAARDDQYPIGLNQPWPPGELQPATAQERPPFPSPAWVDRLRPAMAAIGPQYDAPAAPANPAFKPGDQPWPAGRPPLDHRDYRTTPSSEGGGLTPGMVRGQMQPPLPPRYATDYDRRVGNDQSGTNAMAGEIRDEFTAKRTALGNKLAVMPNTAETAAERAAIEKEMAEIDASRARFDVENADKLRDNSRAGLGLPPVPFALDFNAGDYNPPRLPGSDVQAAPPAALPEAEVGVALDPLGPRAMRRDLPARPIDPLRNPPGPPAPAEPFEHHVGKILNALNMENDDEARAVIKQIQAANPEQFQAMIAEARRRYGGQ